MAPHCLHCCCSAPTQQVSEVVVTRQQVSAKLAELAAQAEQVLVQVKQVGVELGC